jgi:hypothetical protein
VSTVEIFNWLMIVLAVGAILWTLLAGSIDLKGWEVSRTEDPYTYWLLVGVELAVCGYFVYRVLSD